MITLVILKKIRNPNICNLESARPMYDPEYEPGYIRTNDSRALANFQGFLQFKIGPGMKSTSKYKYLDLELNYIKSYGDSLLTLVTDCYLITISMDSTAKAVSTIGLFTRSQPKNHLIPCLITDPSMKFRNKQHYSCKRMQKYSCYDLATPPDQRDRLIATLFINLIKFELGGDPNTIKDGIFSTDPSDC